MRRTPTKPKAKTYPASGAGLMVITRRDLKARLRRVLKMVDYFLGAGPHAATRVERPDGVFEIRMFDAKVVGHGNTTKEAAVHLAEQLREIAYLVEAHEGQKR
jgi:hypothetical protein